MLGKHSVIAGALLATILVVPSASAEYASLDEAAAAAREQEKPLLLDFYTEW